jgi:SAM-dependent methyltransferase
MATPDPLLASYDRVAAEYTAQIADELAGKPLDRALLRVFAEQVDGPIADLGCGPGHVAAFLADAGATVVVHLDEWWQHPVDIDFHFLPVDRVTDALHQAAFSIEATLQRAPYPGVEHASRRAYLMARKQAV